MNKQFAKELSDLINRHSVDNELETPDFILADFVVANLEALKRAQKSTAVWKGGAK